LRRFLAACVLTLSACSALAAELPAEGSTEVLFTPWDDVEGGLIAVLAKARRSIQVQAYLLTSRNIAKALLQAHQRGVKVEILADAGTALKGESSQIPQLAAAGIPVWLETRYANAHNKVMLVDVGSAHPAVLTGSYNYTWSAQARNAENLLILRDNHALANAYLKNWLRHQREAEPFNDVPASGK
jgi:phosphatidylserine/phosphatidylglycerophosphate/cardiolipin synthase-like enzyme